MPKPLIQKQPEEAAPRQRQEVALRREESRPPGGEELDLSLYMKLYEECSRRYGDDRCEVIKQMYSSALEELVARVVAEELRRRGVDYKGRICVEL